VTDVAKQVNLLRHFNCPGIILILIFITVHSQLLLSISIVFLKYARMDENNKNIQSRVSSIQNSQMPHSEDK
jgi:hypothetical protein